MLAVQVATPFALKAVRAVGFRHRQQKLSPMIASQIHVMKPLLRLPELPDPPSPAVRPAGALVAGLLACGLLFLNAAVRPSSAIEDLKAPRRYWEDMSVGISAYFYADDQPGVPTIHVGNPVAMDYRQHYRKYTIRVVNELGIKPWQFWRTVPIRPSLRKDRIVARGVDDPGRPALLALAFRMAGAAFPYLGLWLGILVAGPVLMWLAWELWRAGFPVAGTILPLLLASSAFVVDTLTLAYSAQAFYTVAVLLLVVVAVVSRLGRASSHLGLVVRLLVAGSVFALCVLGRMSVMAILPAFLLAIVLKAGINEGRSSISRIVRVGAVAVALFMTPYALIRQANHHAIWGDVWEGLGDFDQEYDHVWSDSVLRNVLRREGMNLPPGVGVEFENDQSEQILRRLVVGAITRDPMWYAGILLQRTAATLSQSKLRPYAPWDGQSMESVWHPNQGRMDVYYSLAARVDFLTFGGTRVELPVGLMIAPTLILVLLRTFSDLIGVQPAARTRLNGYLGSLFILGLGTASLPICITTASAFEVQSFALVYFVGSAFFVEEARRHLQSVRRD
jgi:hypothetical protein